MSELRQPGQVSRDPGDDDAWVQQLWRCFPIPNVRYGLPLLDAMARVRDRVPWWAELPSALRAALEPLDRVRARLAQTPPAGGWMTPERAAKGLVGEFDLAGAIHGQNTGAPQPAATEVLRLILIVCNWRWSATGMRRESSIGVLAAAIRGVGRLTTQGIPPLVLRELGSAAKLTEVLSAAEGVRDGPHRTLAEAWTRHFEPELRLLDRPVPPSRGRPRPPASPPPAPPQKSGKSRRRVKEDTADDALLDALNDAIRIAPSPFPAEAPLPGEFEGETRPTVVIAPLVHAPSTSTSEDLLRYQALQAIRHQNVHLLPNHPDVVPHAAYRRIIQHLIGQIDASAVGSEARVGAAAMLMVAVTGRTARTLRAFRMVDRAQAHLPGSLDFLPEGILRISVFWRLSIEGEGRSFFIPNEHQAPLLEKVGSEIDLPLAPEIARVFNAAAADLSSLASRETQDIQRLLRDAMRRVASDGGVDFTAGRVRASFAAHLFETCRDLPLTQLIAADSLGQSLAPLAYYAPRRQAVADAYWAVQSRLLDMAAPSPQVTNSDERVGAQLIPVYDAVRQMASASGNRLHGGAAQMAAAGQVEAIHRAMVNQLGAMLLAVATHRPTNALFELTVHDILLGDDGDCALFRDKRIDVAHDPRLVVLPDIVGRQFRKYFEHLIGLAERMPTTAQRVEEALSGQQPLLFAIQAGRTAPLDIAAWSKQLPSSWTELPQNWGRHWCRNAAVESGIRPELVLAQMGHLEATGYPWSGGSPTEPAEFVAELAPQWSRLASMQGWRVLSGLTGGLPKNVGLTALRPWSSAIRAHEEGFRAEQRQWKVALAARMKALRAQAKVDVRSVPLLIANGIIARYDAGSASLEPHGLSRDDFERVRDTLFESTDDLALALARANELCHLAKRVNRACGRSDSNPSPIRHFRRPLDNAMVPEMLLAVRQVRSLRDHLGALDTSGNDWRDASLACARAVLALVLFGFASDANRIRAAIERRTLAVRSAGMPDVILVPCGDHPSDVSALRGIAAIAFAHFARKHPAVNIQWSDVDRRLRELLPDWATHGASRSAASWLELLCETVAVSNRFELSPAARLADAPTGAVSATMTDQLALLDGDPVGTILRPSRVQNDVTAATLSHVMPGKGSARTQYLALCRVLPSPGSKTRLPLTAVDIESGQARAEVNRRHVVAEIDAMLALGEPESRLQPIVALLAGWVRDMLVNGTARKARPAFSTVATYLTRIGGGLVNVFGKSSLAGLGDDELERAYDFLLEHRLHSRSHTAATILDFHRFGSAAGILPEVDLAPVFAHLRDEGTKADARFILPQERAEAARLLTTAADCDTSDPGLGRIQRQAQVAFPVYAYHGARRAEVLGLRFQDQIVDQDRLVLRIRSNRSRALKTLAARRQIVLAGQHATVFENWCALDRSRLDAYRAGTAYVFASLRHARSAETRSRIADAVIQACREATGRPDARIHALRHLVAMECVVPVFLSGSDHLRLGAKMLLKPLATGTHGVLLPRDLQGQVVDLGHADASTTLRWYVHLPWLMQSRATERVQAGYVRATTLAALLGVTRHAVHWNVKRASRDSRVDGLLDVEMPTRSVPTGTREASHEVEATRMLWSAQRLGELLAIEDRLGSLVGALQVMGARVDDELALRTAILSIERHLGRRLLREVYPIEGSRRPRRHLRRMERDTLLENLWRRFDEGSVKERHALAALARSVVDHMGPKDLDAILLPEQDARQLDALLHQLGIGTSQRSHEPAGTGMVLIRAWWDPQSSGKPAATRAGRGMGLALKRVLAVIAAVDRLAV